MTEKTCRHKKALPRPVGSPCLAPILPLSFESPLPTPGALSQSPVASPNPCMFQAHAVLSGEAIPLASSPHTLGKERLYWPG